MAITMKREFIQLRRVDDKRRQHWHIPTNDGLDTVCKAFEQPEIIVVRFTSTPPQPLCGNCARLCATLLEDMVRYNRQPIHRGILSRLLGRGKSPTLKVVSEITTIAKTKSK